MDSDGFSGTRIFYCPVPVATTTHGPQNDTFHQNGMVEETGNTSMSTCQHGMPPIQLQLYGMGSPVGHGGIEEPQYTCAHICQPGMTPLQPGNKAPPPPYSPKCDPPPPYHIALQQQPADFHVPYQSSPADPDHPGGPDEPGQSFVGPMVMSCIAIWCCGVLFGLIAWTVAVIGRGIPEEKTRQRYAIVSFMISGFGIFTGFILCIVLSMTMIY